MSWREHLDNKFTYKDDSLISVKSAEEAFKKYIEQKKKEVIDTANSEDYKGQMNLLDKLETELSSNSDKESNGAKP